MSLFNENAPVAQKEVNVTEEMNQALITTRLNYPLMQESVGKAVTALNFIPDVIINDVQDQEAEQILVRVRATYNKVSEELRKPITSVMDKIKEYLMLPEKQISIDAKAVDSLYNKKRAVRTAYAYEKEKEAEVARAKAKADQAAKEEIIRLKGVFEKVFFDSIVNSVMLFEVSINRYIAEITLENYDEKIKAFNARPNLKQAMYESWFSVPYNQAVLSSEAFTAFIETVRETYPYEKINTEYVEKVLPFFQTKKDGLVDLHHELVRLSLLEKENAAEAERQRNAKIESDRIAEENRQSQLAAEVSANDKRIEAATAGELQTASFEAQVATQAATGYSGSMRKTFIAEVKIDDKEIVGLFADVLYKLFLSNDFGGYVKREKNGMIKTIDGLPVYQDWAKELLAEYVKIYGNTPLKGLEFREVLATVARAKKEKTESL